MTDWKKSWLTLQYRWHTLLLCGAVFCGIFSLVIVVWASKEQPECSDWNAPWYHHLTTVAQIRSCITNGLVLINQRDEGDATLLLRLVRDDRDRRRWFYLGDDYQSGQYGTSRKERRAMIEELLRWDDLDVDVADDRGRTPLAWAVKKRKSWPVAAQLLKKGARVEVTAKGEEKFREQGLPILEAGFQRFANPFTGEVDFDALADCQTANCLLGEVVKEAE